MRAIVLVLALIALVSAKKASTDEPPKPKPNLAPTDDLRTGVIVAPPSDCKRKVKSGDRVKVHYTGWTRSDAAKFDSSRDRNDPFQFTVGQGMVIKGWDLGVLGMCVGEKRRLTIPSGLGYGDSGSPPKIPGKATLVFNVELMSIVGADAQDEDDSEDL